MQRIVDSLKRLGNKADLNIRQKLKQIPRAQLITICYNRVAIFVCGVVNAECLIRVLDKVQIRSRQRLLLEPHRVTTACRHGFHPLLQRLCICHLHPVQQI